MAELDLPGPELVAGIQKHFANDERPATTAMIANAYGTMALTVDLMVSLGALIAKSDPSVVLTPEWKAVEATVKAVSLNLASNLNSIALPESDDGK